METIAVQQCQHRFYAGNKIQWVRENGTAEGRAAVGWDWVLWLLRGDTQKQSPALYCHCVTLKV